MPTNYFNKIFFLLVLFLSAGMNSNAQLLKKLKNSAQKAAERTIERKVEKKTEEKTGEAMDSLFNTPGKVKNSEKKSKQKLAEEPTDHKTESSGEKVASLQQNQQNITTGSQFFPDGTLLFEEQFQQDLQGDFPANWETNSGGEIILVNGQKALKFYPDGVYLANTGILPENYAMEFDLATSNLDYKGLAGSRFGVIFSNEKTLNKKPANGADFSFSLWYNGQSDYVLVKNWGKVSSKIDNKISYNIKSKLNTTTHFTLVVNKKRLRVYADNEKLLDLPSLLQNNIAQYVTFYLNGTSNAQNHIVAISDVKITEEGQDLRSQILKGGFSTTKILFASGSDKLKDESFSFIDKLAQTLNDDISLSVSIIGHTDSDGAEAANLTLSKKRAESVKRYLVGNGVQEDRLQTDGKGESDPVASNNTAEGKAQNRRVEFKKL